MTDPRLARPLWRGRTNVDAITIAAIEAAEKLAGFTFEITQGSYQGTGGDSDSAGTHALGGVVDLRARGLSQEKRRRMIWALRKVGFAAWLREEWMGDWPDHVHAVLIDHPRLAESAARQVAEYRAGGDGLAGGRPDYHPRPDPIPVYVWEDDDMPYTEEQLENIVERAVDAKLKAYGLHELAADEKARAVSNLRWRREVRKRFNASDEDLDAIQAAVEKG